MHGHLLLFEVNIYECISVQLGDTDDQVLSYCPKKKANLKSVFVPPSWNGGGH